MIPLLHIKIPGEPYVQERHRWSGRHNYDPSAKDKAIFLRELQAAVPRIKDVGDIRVAFLLEVWTAKPPVDEWEKIPGTKKKRKTGRKKYQTDWDNYGKFYSDALTGTLYDNDWRIEDGRVILHRSALEPRIELLVWELP